MKEKSSNSKTENGGGGTVKGLLIRKNSPEGILLNRIRRVLLSSNLNPCSSSSSSSSSSSPLLLEEVTSGDRQNSNKAELQIGGKVRFGSTYHREKVKEEEGEGDNETFLPSIKMKRIEENVLISITVLKNASLSSTLFRILEEEKIDIIYENQYRTETKVSYTILVSLPEEEVYNVDGLKEKLCEWAS